MLPLLNPLIRCSCFCRIANAGFRAEEDSESRPFLDFDFDFFLPSPAAAVASPGGFAIALSSAPGTTAGGDPAAVSTGAATPAEASSEASGSPRSDSKLLRGFSEKEFTRLMLEPPAPGSAIPEPATPSPPTFGIAACTLAEAAATAGVGVGQRPAVRAVAIDLRASRDVLLLLAVLLVARGLTCAPVDGAVAAVVATDLRARLPRGRMRLDGEVGVGVEDTVLKGVRRGRGGMEEPLAVL